ncbi:hypothetical protein [Nonomuraea sp. NPDC049784]|uniref:hypothetical protein n=1 Tax=Nonomuraea sp. NPDC049784 TaxID=3154361 RepID=UPI0033EA999D
MLSGYGLHAVGIELDALAAVVIGRTLLTGGSRYLLGTVRTRDMTPRRRSFDLGKTALPRLPALRD